MDLATLRLIGMPIVCVAESSALGVSPKQCSPAEVPKRECCSATGSDNKITASSESGVDTVMARMQGLASSSGLTSARFLSVEPGYYDQPLEWRCKRLCAGSVDELCKSIVLENTRLDKDSDPQRVRCVLVIVQYVAKLVHAKHAKLIDAVQQIEASRGLPAMGKKQYSFRLLDGDECASLTGFEYNAVTPLGLDLPMLLSHKIAELPSGSFWMGGGHVDLKLNLGISETVDKLKATVADITA